MYLRGSDFAPAFPTAMKLNKNYSCVRCTVTMNNSYINTKPTDNSWLPIATALGQIYQ